ncbi:MAG: GNAT family acetyltransferase [Thiotrichales bacterium]|nr:GNAT family acetyltransferase [Thiotrichales bacterium]|tara:strand:+ start:364 stop:801 length:438 start_codon:yes stop_codon:yes gene_type:complete
MSEHRPASIRSYRHEDRQQIESLWRRIHPDAPAWNIPEHDIERKMSVQPELFLVACVQERVVGTVMDGFDGHRSWIHLLAVAPEHRRVGIGSALMQAAEHGLIVVGCSKVNLQVREGNEAVVRFYRRLGYDIEPRVSLGKRIGEA